MQLFSRRNAIQPRQVDIDNRNVGPTGARRGDYIRAVFDSRHHFQVRFEFDECYECASDHSHVLGE